MTDDLRADLTAQLQALEANHGALDPGGVERGRLLRLRAALRPGDPTDEPVEFGPPPFTSDPTEEPVS